MDSLTNINDHKTQNNVISSLLAIGSVPKNCEYCGKPFVKTEVSMFGRKKTVYALDCDCLTKKDKDDEKKRREEFLQNKFAKANIGKRYADITLDKLVKMGTENVFNAKKYVNEFDPESGKSIHMIGEFGNGKTSVGYAIVKELVPNFNCVSITWNEFVTRCYYSKSFGSRETLEQILNWISQFDLVMLDEFCVNIKDDKEINLATELFDNWYKDNKCFILINNPCDIVDMKKIPRLGKLFDRAREQAEKFIFEHGSYRQKD